LATQRLLNRAVWDTFAAMGVVRRFAVAGLDEAARRGGLVIGALDETGQEKTGTATAGVQRQYLGCAGKVANGINTVHLACVREAAMRSPSASRLTASATSRSNRSVMAWPESLLGG
jgi:hypothetical protein